MVTITASWGSRKAFGFTLILPVYSIFLRVNLKCKKITIKNNSDSKEATMKNASKKQRFENRSGKKKLKPEHLKGRLIRYESLPGIVAWSSKQETIRLRPGPDDWLVTGRVVGPGGRGLPDLRISVFDKDLLFDDRLGESVTDANGEFYILYHTNDFEDLFDAQPDLYVKVMNEKGKMLFTSEKAVRWQSDRVEYFEIEIR